MNIPNEILGKWEALKSDGDLTVIASELGVGRQVISKALNTGKASDRVFQAMAEFYKKKAELVESYMPTPNV